MPAGKGCETGQFLDLYTMQNCVDHHDKKDHVTFCHLAEVNKHVEVAEKSSVWLNFQKQIKHHIFFSFLLFFFFT